MRGLCQLRDRGTRCLLTGRRLHRRGPRRAAGRRPACRGGGGSGQLPDGRAVHRGRLTAVIASSHGRTVLIVGAGLGGARTAKQLRAAGFDERITLVGSETHPPYDRPPLSKQVLAGKWPPERTQLLSEPDVAELDLDLRLGAGVASIDGSEVLLETGDRIGFDDLVIASGVSARTLPGQPSHAALHVLRTLDDCLRLREHLTAARSLLIVGGGFIGAEVAAVARTQGIDVTMVEALPLPLARVLGATVARQCADLHRDNGVRIVGNATIEQFVATNGAAGVVLAAGETIEADCVLVGVGTVLNTAW
ncbi:MAG: NAD(P)/FAD-dependent oxidoreductase, partial [Pseudonocardiaceae bacterium]|nr:NAD(P)/FAD-dependent oxidoreductase [Pseudonocardiaceae bacterium]